MKVIAEFKECPDCKVDARLMNSIVQEEIAKGNMGVDTISFIDIRVVCNVDPKKPPIVGGRIPGARITRDMCTKCGKEFTTKIEIGYITPPTRPNMPPIFA